jgi:hypothetical protein
MDVLGFSSFKMPDGWELFSCCDLGKLIDSLRAHLKEKYDDLLKDEHFLYDDVSAQPRHKDPFGYGTWKGHIQQYEQGKKNLEKVVNKYNDEDCWGELLLTELGIYMIKSLRDTIDKPPPEMPDWARDRWKYMPPDPAIHDTTFDFLAVYLGIKVTLGLGEAAATLRLPSSAPTHVPGPGLAPAY